jgi:sulfite exporter TauE/SafE
MSMLAQLRLFDPNGPQPGSSVIRCLVCSRRRLRLMASLGRAPVTAAAPTGWRAVSGPARAAVAGGLWVGWPCGLLQGALLVASLTGSAASGAGAMAVFAVASSPGLLLAPWIWQKISRSGDSAARRERWAIRAAGGMLAAASGWSLTHGLWERFAAFCAQL